MQISICNDCKKPLNYNDLELNGYYRMVEGVDEGNIFRFFNVNGKYTLANLSCDMLPLPTPEKYLEAKYTKVALTITAKDRLCKS